MDHQSHLTTHEQMVSPFTYEDDQKIIELFNEGHSMGSIANQLNRSRSAVAGRIHRLRKKLNEDKLPKRDKPKVRVKIVNTPSKPKLVTLKKPSLDKKVRLRMIDIDSTEVTLQELEKHHCRFPKGDPRHSDFRFCGKPRISESERTPYCQEHTLLCGRQYHH